MQLERPYSPLGLNSRQTHITRTAYVCKGRPPDAQLGRRPQPPRASPSAGAYDQQGIKWHAARMQGGASKVPLEHRPLELYNWQSHVAVRTHAPMWLCACNQWLVPHAVPPGAETVCMYLRGGRYTCHQVALSVQPEPHAGPPGAGTRCMPMHGNT